MVHSAEQLNNAILLFSIEFKKEKVYQALIDSHMTKPELCNIVIKDMFLKKFNSYFTSNDLYNAYEIIYDYMAEMAKNGEVNFN